MNEITSSPPHPDGATRPQQFATGVLAVVLLSFGIYTLWHFLSALVWAAIFAIALWPLYRRVRARLGGGDRHHIVLPALFTLGVALIFIVPLALVGIQLAREAHGATDWLRDAQRNGVGEPDLLRHLPFFQAQLDDWWQQILADPGSAKELVQRLTRGHVADAGRVVAAQLVRRLTSFVFTLLTLFFLFREGDVVTAQLSRAMRRTFGASGERIGRQMIVSVHGTVDGLVLVGLGEGVLLGIVYAVAGVPHPTIFGALTAVAAMIPLAAPVVFSLAALWLLAQGSVAWAVAVFCVGLAVTFVADHFIRPTLIGDATKLRFIWVLLGILGCVEMWGLIGLFLGPAIMAALILLWREWVSPAGES